MDVFNAISAACDYALLTGSTEIDLLGICDGAVFSRRFDNAGINTEIPYFGRVTFSGADSRILAERLTSIGLDLEATPSRADNPARRRDRVATWLPSILMYYDHKIETWQRSIANGRYYEVYQIKGRELVPQDSVVTATCTVETRHGRHGVLVERLHFHCYLGQQLALLAIERPVFVPFGGNVHVEFSEISTIAADVPENARPVTPVSSRLMIDFLSRAKHHQFTVAGGSFGQHGRTSFYSSGRPLFRFAKTDTGVNVQLDVTTLGLGVAKLRQGAQSFQKEQVERVVPRWHDAMPPSAEGTPHNRPVLDS